MYVCMYVYISELTTDCLTNVFLFVDNNHLMFRGNSIATKAMETYMRLVGDKV